MRRNLSVLLGLLCATTAFGQGRILYTWNPTGPMGPPVTNLFRASFEIYDFEQAAGTWFSGTHMFELTLTVNSPDHTWLPGTAASYASGFTGPGGSLYLDAVCHDPTFPDPLYVRADSIGTDATFHESGYWTFSPVPEPSCTTLLGLSLLLLLRSRRWTGGL
jgi:hypothetical protein